MNEKLPLIFDAHLDLGMNAMEWNRDLRRSVQEIRDLEAGMKDKPDRGQGTVAFPEMREGNIGLVVATMIARYVKPGNPIPGWNSPEQAWAQTRGQLAWYREMEMAGELKQIRNKKELETHAELWQKREEGVKLPIGYILSLEGADSIVDLSHVQKNYQEGLRALGPAHYGPGTYAFGTDSTGGLGIKGRELLKEMQRFNLILDITHLCDESFYEAIDLYHGPVWASHHNSRTLVPHNRQMTDEMAKILFDRDSVIGVALDAWMLAPGWDREKDTPLSMQVCLNTVVDHIDHFCQLAGNSNHVGIGSDLDGAFGKEQSPYDVETINDLQKIAGLLCERKYTEQDVRNIFYENFTRFLKTNLPE